MTIPAIAPAARPEADAASAGAEAELVGIGVEEVMLAAELGKKRERTSAPVQCIDEFEFLERG